MASVSDAATKGFTNALAYDANRPSYPPKAVEALLERLQICGFQGARVVDLAAGTGKFSEMLSARVEDYEIIAVEPHPEMRSQLEGKRLRRVSLIDGSATKMSVESQTADAVVAAQAFHWFATNETLEEIYRVLVPGGVFGMIWNVEDYNAPKSWEPRTVWESKMKDIMWSFDDQHPRFRHESWREVFDKQLSSNPFTIQSTDPLFSLPLGEDSVNFTYWLTTEAVWERFHSLSQIAVLEGEELQSVRRSVMEALAGPDVERNDKGELPLHGRTVYAWTSAIPGMPLKSGG